MAGSVKPLNKAEELKKILEEADQKVVVLEFMKPDNQVYKYVKSEVEKIAQEMSGKADFYELNVDTFMKYAQKFHVEALPAFVLMNKLVKKRHVLDTDELRQAIIQVHNKIQRDQQSSGQDGRAAGLANKKEVQEEVVNRKEAVQEEAPRTQKKKEVQGDANNSWGGCVLM